MAEQVPYRKKMKKSKKKKRLEEHDLALPSVPEESSIQSMEQICEIAAENFLMDVIAAAAEELEFPQSEITHLKDPLSSCNLKQTENEKSMDSQVEEMNIDIPHLNSETDQRLDEQKIDSLESATIYTAAANDDTVVAENDNAFAEDDRELAELAAEFAEMHSEFVLNDVALKNNDASLIIKNDTTGTETDTLSKETSNEMEKFIESVKENLPIAGTLTDQKIYPNPNSPVTPLKEKPSVVKPTQNTGVEEAERQILKPSVFISKGKMNSSSLQIGCRWDRTRYNVVLMPDLKKVVYPDLDALLLNKPSSDPFASPRYENLTPFMPVDRSSKPNRVHMNSRIQEEGPTANHLERLEDSVHVGSASPINKVCKENLNCMKVNADDSRYTDYNIDGVDFRVFMNPVEWSPVDNYQLVIFRVGPLYYEEFFTNCGTTTGLIQSIKERAKELAKRQLILAQTCLLDEFGDSKFVRLSNATLVIYGCKSKFDSTAKWQTVKFGVNEAFYEENFQGCKSFDDLLKSVKNRAEIIWMQQKNLKAKAYSSKSIDGGKLYESLSQNSDEDTNHFMPDEDNVQTANPIEHELTTPGKKSNTFKKKFKSFRNWLKGPFNKKKEEKAANQFTLSEEGRPHSRIMEYGGGSSGNNEILWAWEDVPEAPPLVFMNDSSENVKE